jgi:hypothetical protein
MNKTEALQITGSLSNPSKMPGKAYGCQLKNAKQDPSSQRFQALPVPAATL